MKKLLALALVLIALFAIASSIYPAAGRVAGVEYDADRVLVLDACSRCYIVGGADDWECGDAAALLMWTRFTLDVRDDVVIMARYAG
jgi:hypothetical protein